MKIKKTLVSVLIGLSFPLTVLAQESNESSAEVLYQSANKAFAAHDWNSTKNLLHQIEQQYPGTPAAQAAYKSEDIVKKAEQYAERELPHQALGEENPWGDRVFGDMLRLGVLGIGDSGKPNYKEAFSWYQRAANQGDLRSQCDLGVMYCEGLGVNQDYKNAFYWYKKAAEQGFSDAQLNLGLMYSKGPGRVLSYSHAFFWFKKAADQGNIAAQRDLGVMYYEGLGVNKNLIFSYAIWNMAAIPNSTEQKDLIEFREGVLKYLTPEQVKEGQDLTRRMENVGISKALDEVGY